MDNTDSSPRREVDVKQFAEQSRLGGFDPAGRPGRTHIVMRTLQSVVVSH
ncbi:MAG: hypothetical protein ACRDSP_09305 [Pseudonocardiaceae bacterium]